MRNARLLALTLHVAFVVALLAGAVATYVGGHQETRGPMADWAAMDAALSTVVAIALVVVAGLHALAAVAWFGNPANRWVLVMPLTIAAYLVLVWVSYARTDLVGWQVVVTGIAAATASLTIGRRRPAPEAGS